jgi:hypothetical protein
MSSDFKKFKLQYNIPDNVTNITLESIAALSNIPIEILQLVFNRGSVIERIEPIKFSFNKVINRKPKGKGFERVYSFIMKNKKIYYGLDDDIRIAFNLE